MYVPSSFAETDLKTLHRFIEQHSFATLVTNADGSCFASHLPLLLDRSEGEFGQLTGHLAKANPQAGQLQSQNLLTIFQGPHAYISPTWYESEHTVPTWNYQAVHVYGSCTLETDPGQLKQILEQYVDFYESVQTVPWSIPDADTDFIDSLLSAIVGFRIQIERIEGKFKLSQNHTAERQQKVIKALQQQAGENQRAIAARMQANLHQNGNDSSARS
ncbi:FMN-binding negative transcriptional regulator [Gimesia sp.]|uniref:FMN-binding negative transcriptional regulator n=1 Tax=Gimesia sp. TaxID=2024833 RepID=UPI000C3C742E|nr:FMN-binding negative transcriptional regulator [Gimesia sp.]MAX39003.1 transcriptional regulator [Gimesia sp.]HAH47428.1 FMN-binding negative transcriptional regulator [Planctomycetaceae bacterium]|tara:strand:+ start:18684 stop:19334 length:651 start_codon:yes stop_codon:yes gene_type:complete